MVPSQIEKEILIEAPIDVVWRAVTEPEQMKHWFASEAELNGRSGGEGRLSFASGQTYYLYVEVFEPPHRFAYRWMHEKGARPRPENSMLVEFILQAENGHTRLRLVESGFDHVDWGDEEKTRYFEDHSRGWDRFTGLLRDYAAR